MPNVKNKLKEEVKACNFCSIWEVLEIAIRLTTEIKNKRIGCQMGQENSDLQKSTQPIAKTRIKKQFQVENRRMFEKSQLKPKFTSS